MGATVHFCNVIPPIASLRWRCDGWHFLPHCNGFRGQPCLNAHLLGSRVPGSTVLLIRQPESS